MRFRKVPSDFVCKNLFHVVFDDFRRVLTSSHRKLGDQGQRESNGSVKVRESPIVQSGSEGVKGSSQGLRESNDPVRV